MRSEISYKEAWNLDIPKNQKLVLLCISFYSDNFNRSLSGNEVAEMCGLSLSVTYKMLRYLEEKNLITVENLKKYIGNYLTNNQQERNSSKCKDWAIAVLERDKYFCRWCGNGENLHAHHIKSFAKNIHLRLDVENGITFCRDCHKKVHWLIRLMEK